MSSPSDNVGDSGLQALPAPTDDDDDATKELRAWFDTNTTALRYFKERFAELAVSDIDLDVQKLLVALLLATEATRTNLLKMPLNLQCDICGPSGNPYPLRDDAFVIELLRQGDAIKFLRGAWDHGSDSLSPSESRKCIEAFQILITAFKAPFKGRNVDMLCTALDIYDREYDRAKHFGKTVAVIQSSGTGKSRMVAELSNTDYVLSMCFRDIQNNQHNPQRGWPPHDSPACRFFERSAHARFPKCQEEKIAGAFLGAVMEVVVEKLRTYDDPRAFSAAWAWGDPPAYDKSERHLLFERIRQKAMKNLEDLCTGPRITAGSRSAVFGNIETQFEQAIRKRAEFDQAIYTRVIQKHAQDLQQICTDRGVKFFFAIDDCTQLEQCSESRRHPSNMLSALRRMIKTCDSMDFWFLLMDTNPNLQEMSSGTGQLVSSFGLLTDCVPLAPHTYLQLNTMASDVATTPRDALRLHFLKNYGRPYWSTLTARELLGCASVKLLCNDTFNPLNHSHVLALFSSRLLLKLRVDEAATRLAADGVHNHMRMLTGISAGGLVETAVPSEPTLAIAATELLLESSVKYGTALDILAERLILEERVVDRDDQDGLLARILLMLAMDFAIPPQPHNPERRSILEPHVDEADPRVRLVSLDVFLKTLLGDNLGIEEGRPEMEIKRRELLAWASTHQLNLTHFYQFDAHVEGQMLTPELLFDCWRRGVALVCSSTRNRFDFDILCISYHGDLTKEFTPAGLGMIVLQVTNNSPERTPITHMTCPRVDAADTIPHMVIRLDFAAPAGFAPDIGFDAAASKLDDTESLAYEQSNEPERYWINVRGFGPEQYPLLNTIGRSLMRVFAPEEAPVELELRHLAEKMKRTLDPLDGHFFARAG